jgi:hypothetical protein
MRHGMDQRVPRYAAKGADQLTPETPGQAERAEQLAKELRKIGADPKQVVDNFWRKVAQRGVVFKHTLPYLEQ